MSDFLSETPNMARPVCPACEPEADPTAEILEVRYCYDHPPPRDGADDQQVSTQAYLSASAEAGGQENAAWCKVIHRDRK